jgi:Ca2+-binding EF-hand superfamily protein
MASNAPYDAQASTNYKEAFALFDKRGNQRVQLESLGDLLRACGQNPTLQEIRELEKNVGSDCRFPCIPPPLPKSVPDPLPRGERRMC